MDYAFMNAYNLSGLPETQNFPSSTLYANSCFENCINLKTLPKHFHLGSQLIQKNDFFKNTGLTEYN